MFFHRNSYQRIKKINLNFPLSLQIMRTITFFSLLDFLPDFHYSGCRYRYFVDPRNFCRDIGICWQDVSKNTPFIPNITNTYHIIRYGINRGKLHVWKNKRKNRLKPLMVQNIAAWKTGLKFGFRLHFIETLPYRHGQQNLP